MKVLSPQQIAYEAAHIHESRAPALLVPLIIFELIALACVVGRVWARRRSRTPLGLDDYLIVAAMVG